MYVDDFLIMAPKGPLRDAVVEALKSLWQFGPERTLSPATSLTFLGIDWVMRKNGDIFLTQERFVKELLEKYKMSNCRTIKSISIDKPPEKEEVPNAQELTELQSYAGAFNWLGKLLSEAGHVPQAAPAQPVMSTSKIQQALAAQSPTATLASHGLWQLDSRNVSLI